MGGAPEDAARAEPGLEQAVVKLVVVGAGRAALTVATRLQGIRNASEVLGARREQGSCCCFLTLSLG